MPQEMITNTLKLAKGAVILIAPSLLLLMGASGLDKICISGAGSDAAWYSHALKSVILSDHRDNNLIEIVKKAVHKVNKEFKRFPGYEYVNDFPSAVISMSRVAKGKLEVLVLGDCTCIIKKKDETIERIADRRIEPYDQKAIDKGIEMMQEKNIDFCDTRKYYQDILTNNRKMKNKEGGYYCLSNDEQAVNHSYVYSFDLDEIHSVALMSDGFSQIIDLFHLYDDETFMKALSEDGVEKLYEQLYAAQKHDDKMNSYPRFSFSDDMTLIYYEV